MATEITEENANLLIRHAEGEKALLEKRQAFLNGNPNNQQMAAFLSQEMAAHLALVQAFMDKNPPFNANRKEMQDELAGEGSEFSRRFEGFVDSGAPTVMIQEETKFQLADANQNLASLQHAKIDRAAMRDARQKAASDAEGFADAGRSSPRDKGRIDSRAERATLMSQRVEEPDEGPEPGVVSKAQAKPMSPPLPPKVAAVKEDDMSLLHEFLDEPVEMKDMKVEQKGKLVEMEDLIKDIKRTEKSGAKPRAAYSDMPKVDYPEGLQAWLDDPKNTENRLVAAVKGAAARIQAAVKGVIGRIQERRESRVGKQEQSPVVSTADSKTQAKMDAAILAWAEGTSEKAVNTLEKSIDQTTSQIERTVNAVAAKEDVKYADIDALMKDLENASQPEVPSEVSQQSAVNTRARSDSVVDEGKMSELIAGLKEVPEPKATAPASAQTTQPKVDVVPPAVAPNRPVPPPPPQAATAEVAQPKAAVTDDLLADLDVEKIMAGMQGWDSDSEKPVAPASTSAVTPQNAVPPMAPVQTSQSAAKTHAWKEIMEETKSVAPPVSKENDAAAKNVTNPALAGKGPPPPAPTTGAAAKGPPPRPLGSRPLPPPPPAAAGANAGKPVVLPPSRSATTKVHLKTNLGPRPGGGMR
ncbi:MAG TPA: hypothetical protein VGV92_09695 [Gammaproteobacteria bacterium]|nr:hypothetical protein [Gammaproteobacteria bacterium]